MNQDWGNRRASAQGTWRGREGKRAKVVQSQNEWFPGNGKKCGVEEGLRSTEQKNVSQHEGQNMA